MLAGCSTGSCAQRNFSAREAPSLVVGNNWRLVSDERAASAGSSGLGDRTSALSAIALCASRHRRCRTQMGRANSRSTAQLGTEQKQFTALITSDRGNLRRVDERRTRFENPRVSTTRCRSRLLGKEVALGDVAIVLRQDLTLATEGENRAEGEEKVPVRTPHGCRGRGRIVAGELECLYTIRNPKHNRTTHGPCWGNLTC